MKYASQLSWIGTVFVLRVFARVRNKIVAANLALLAACAKVFC